MNTIIRAIRTEITKFKYNKAAIYELNHNFYSWLLICAAIVFVTIGFLSYTIPGYEDVRESYMIFAIGSLAALFIQSYLPDKIILPVYYVSMNLALVYAAYSSAILFPNELSIICLALFVITPCLVLDISVRVFVIEIAMSMVYTLVVMPYKNPEVAGDELMAVICFSIVGLVLGESMRRVRLQNIELLRQGVIRETTDVLTGLANRRKLFDLFIDCEAGNIERPVTAISIIDIDFFKQYNDTYGHLEGDNCLKAVGECFMTYGMEHDMQFYRYGGEEFVAVSHETEKDKIKEIFTNIGSAVEAIKIPRESGYVTISQGVYIIPDDDKAANAKAATAGDEHASIVSEYGSADTHHKNNYRFQKYLSEADEALYEAKELGRNRTIVRRQA